MPYYKKLNPKISSDKRTAEKLLVLKTALDNSIPAKTVDQTLLLASWNIRELGGTKYGGREKEALFYLAEILSRFDLIAVQEVRDNLDALDGLMSILGGWCRAFRNSAPAVWSWTLDAATGRTPSHPSRRA